MHADPAAVIVRAREGLGPDPELRAANARDLAGLADQLPDRLAEVVRLCADYLAGGAAPEIPRETVDAIVSIALDGVSQALAGSYDDEEIDAHRAALHSLAPIPGLDSAPEAEPAAIERTRTVEFAIARSEAPPVPPSGEVEPLTDRPSPELVSAFQAEARELLSVCETGLLRLESDPSDASIVPEVFRALHSFKGNCGFLGFGAMEELAHRAESLLVRLKEGRRRLDPTAVTALLRTVDALGRTTESAGTPGTPGAFAPLLALLDQVMDGPAAPTASEAVIAPPAPLVDEPLAEVTKKVRAEGTLRVDVTKVDQLLDLVGELIIASTAVRHVPNGEGTEEEARGRASGQLDRVVRSLQDVAMSLRMVPIGPVFQRMVRVVRDVSQRVGKPVELRIEGEDTEIDKTVAELVTDPLVHIVRNAIDHGLEPPDERVAAGKPRAGHLRLVGSQVGGEVWIRVEDDGRGLNRQKILAKAVQNGLVTAEAGEALSDAEVYQFIFASGFSTAAAVTDVSGRGVGMDVVRKNVEMVKGRVDIKSTPGQGTSFTLRIPLTLAIIEGMLVRVGEATFTVPLLCIRESVVVRAEDVTVLSTWQEMVRIRGELLPVLRLHRAYDLPADKQALHEGILVVVEDGGQALCLFVDELIGQRQTVIKPISGYLGTVGGIAGCTVLGDGRISLILDVGALVQRAGLVA